MKPRGVLSCYAVSLVLGVLIRERFHLNAWLCSWVVANIFGSEHIAAGQQTASPIKELLEHSLRLRTLLPCKRKQDGSRCPGRLQCSSTRNPLLLADDGTYVDVRTVCYVSSSTMTICAMGFWTLSCNFHTRGHRAQCYLLHFFPVETVKQNVRQTFPEWTEGFHFPPALLKLRATLEGSIIPLYHQGCIAINTRGATLYGSKRSLVRRMIMHIQHHEEPLLTVLAGSVPAREAIEDMDPLDAFLQTRPFQGSLTRRAGFWTFNDRLQQPPLRVNTPTNWIRRPLSEM